MVRPDGWTPSVAGSEVQAASAPVAPTAATAPNSRRNWRRSIVGMTPDTCGLLVRGWVRRPDAARKPQVVTVLQTPRTGATGEASRSGQRAPGPGNWVPNGTAMCRLAQGPRYRW